MGNSSKTKKQLIDELGQLRQRISELQAVEAELKESNELFQTQFYSFCRITDTRRGKPLN